MKALAKYYGAEWGGRLTWGGTGSWETKGCYYYENGKYAGKVYYSTGGVLWTQNANIGFLGEPIGGKRRFDALCHKNTTYQHRTNVLTMYQNPRAQIEEMQIANGTRIMCDCSEKEMVQGSIGNVSGKCSHSPRGRRY